MNNKKYKILTACVGGNVRSVGLKYLLKYKYGHEALNCGIDANSKETVDMLCEWADYIIVTTKELIDNIDTKFKSKLLCYNIGDDVFGYAFHPDLQRGFINMIEAHGLFNNNE